MEVLGLRVSPLISTPFTPKNNPHCNRQRLGKGHCFDFSSSKHEPFRQIRFQSSYRGLVRAQAVDEDYELKQARDMAAARKRWEALVREGKVKVLTPREAGYAIQLSGKPLLDVRPSTEHEKAWVKGSTWIPIFDVDAKFDPGTLSRKITSYMMGIAPFDLLFDYSKKFNCLGYSAATLAKISNVKMVTMISYSMAPEGREY